MKYKKFYEKLEEKGYVKINIPEAGEFLFVRRIDGEYGFRDISFDSEVITDYTFRGLISKIEEYLDEEYGSFYSDFLYQFMETYGVVEPKVIRKFEELAGLTNGKGLYLEKRRGVSDYGMLYLMYMGSPQQSFELDSTDVKNGTLLKAMGFEFEWKHKRTLEEVLNGYKEIDFVVGKRNYTIYENKKDEKFFVNILTSIKSVSGKYFCEEDAKKICDELNGGKVEVAKETTAPFSAFTGIKDGGLIVIDKKELLQGLKGKFKELGFKLKEAKEELFCEEVLSKGDYLTLEIKIDRYDKPRLFTLFVNEKDYCVSDNIIWQSSTDPVLAVLGFFSKALSLDNYHLERIYKG